jgi:hypothetical protein
VFKKKNKQMGLIIFLISLVNAGCEVSETKFEQIKIGDRRDTLIEKLGKPDTIGSIEAPFFSGQRFTWNANGRVYTITIAMDRVVAKTVE